MHHTLAWLDRSVHTWDGWRRNVVDTLAYTDTDDNNDNSALAEEQTVKLWPKPNQLDLHVCVCVVFICDAHTALAESTMFYSVCFSLSRAASLLYEQHTQRLNWICFLCCVSSLATGLLNARVYCAPSKPIQPSTDPIQRVFITYEKYNKIFDDYETGCGHTPPHHLSIYTFVQCSCPLSIIETDKRFPGSSSTHTRHMFIHLRCVHE